MQSRIKGWPSIQFPTHLIPVPVYLPTKDAEDLVYFWPPDSGESVTAISCYPCVSVFPAASCGVFCCYQSMVGLHADGGAAGHTGYQQSSNKTKWDLLQPK